MGGGSLSGVGSRDLGYLLAGLVRDGHWRLVKGFLRKGRVYAVILRCHG